MSKDPKKTTKRTYTTQRFKCLSCKMYSYFGSWGMCQHCVESIFSREDCGGG